MQPELDPHALPLCLSELTKREPCARQELATPHKRLVLLGRASKTKHGYGSVSHSQRWEGGRKGGGAGVTCMYATPS